MYTLVFILIQTFFTRYAEALGITSTTLTLPILAFQAPLVWFVSLGVFFQAVASWNYSIQESTERKRRFVVNADHKAAALSSFLLLTYTLPLFIPFIISSPSTIEAISNLAATNHQFKSLAHQLIGSIQPFIQLPPIIKYGVSQAAASTILFLASAITGLARR